VEEEYQIIDPHTWELSSSSNSLLRTAHQALGERAQPELQLSQIEAATPICRDLQGVRTALRHMRSGMIAAAAQKGTFLVAAGTHPFSHWKSQRITPKERYEEISEYYQQLAREPIFGCHIHVGLNERAMGLQVMNRARIWLTPLLALAAKDLCSPRTYCWKRMRSVLSECAICQSS
jgi:carboxylate-amine ligase